MIFNLFVGLKSRSGINSSASPDARLVGTDKRLLFGSSRTGAFSNFAASHLVWERFSDTPIT